MFSLPKRSIAFLREVRLSERKAPKYRIKYTKTRLNVNTAQKKSPKMLENMEKCWYIIKMNMTKENCT
jgi:hypothetical protein